MLWGLAIVICLAHEGQVECAEWRAEPFKTKYECQQAKARIEYELTGFDIHYLHMKCERGHYS